MRSHRFLALLSIGALLLPACAGGSSARQAEERSVGEDLAAGEHEAAADVEEAAADSSSLSPPAPSPLRAGGTSTTGSATTEAYGDADDHPALSDGPLEAVEDVSLGLRAGSVDDNARFADYLDYRRRFAKTGIPVHDRDVRERHVVHVNDSAGRPVLGARVSLLDGARELQASATHSDGTALLHPLVTDGPDAAGFTIRVQLGDAVAELAVDDRSVRDHTVVLEAAAAEGPTRLDVHFLLDATGSMDDEILRLKETMAEVAARISALPSQPEARWGLTAYRDRGDAYVTRTVDFTDLASFTAELAEVRAAGGGDTPESLNEALHEAITAPSWDPGAVQIMFLVADAPPHLDYPDDADYAVDMFVAAERGITVVPIASSGLDDQGEYIFRQLAQVTLGRFLFLTYGAGGKPGDKTTHDVSGYEVQSLDELVVSYVTEQLAHRESREAQQ